MLTWVAGNLYLWHVIGSQELLLAASVVIAAVDGIPFWRYATSQDRSQRASRKVPGKPRC